MRRSAPLLLAVALVLGAGACTSSDGEGAATTTTSAATTSAAPTTEPATATTAAADGEGLPADCDAVLQQYVDALNPDDLQGAADLFRRWAPDLPTAQAEAALRLADAYEEAGSLDLVDVGDPSLGADAQTLSTWMDSGCPRS